MPHTQKTQRERSAPYKVTTTSYVVLKEDTSAMNPGEQQLLQMTLSHFEGSFKNHGLCRQRFIIVHQGS